MSWTELESNASDYALRIVDCKLESRVQYNKIKGINII